MKLYYAELPPKDRISGFIQNFLFPVFEKEGFKFSKSQNLIKKRSGFFEFHVVFFKNRLNQMSEIFPIVNFEIYVTVHAPEYKKWEKNYYGYDNKIGGSFMDGGNAAGFDNWSETFMKSNWYSLVENDNDELIKVLHKNFADVIFPYFAKFGSLESGIEELLKSSSDGKFFQIFDLLIMSKQTQKAVEYFEKNNSWFEEEMIKNEEDSYFAWNYKDNYIIRLNEYRKLKGCFL